MIMLLRYSMKQAIHSRQHFSAQYCGPNQA